MSLRGSESIWLATADDAGFPALDRDVRVDVAIVGGGIAGVTTALLLKRLGATVAVVERDAVAAGATGYTTAKITALQSTRLSDIRSKNGTDGAAAYAGATLDAIARIATLVEDEAIECDLERRDAFTYAGDEREVASVEREAEAAQEAGLPVELTTDTGLPWEVPAAVRLAGQAQFQPVRYTRGLARRVEGDGSYVFERTHVTNVHEGGPCRVVTAGGGTVTAERAVIATNYPLLDRGLFFARLEATRSYCVALPVRGDVPQGMLITAGQPTRSLRTFRDHLIVGGEGHQTGAAEARPERYEALVEFGQRHFPVGPNAPYRWSTQDGMPVDSLPYIGPYTPRSKRLYVAAGFMKWGMTNATVAAVLLTDLMADRPNPYAAHFDPNRTSLRGLPKLAKLNLHAGQEFLGERVRPAEASSAGDVAAGEARVVRSGAGKIGVFRDEDGAVHGVSLRCTHLGCLLRFNDAERSWDCPCHGSRFDVDGAVLAGPATQPLEPREVEPAPPPGAQAG
ncbi:MAG: FAD-dependent oxidoreductase [Actinomycetota bacterium]|nr:FAD-dependent oxidoreductase [Actinomycetota bacterium]